MNLNDSTLGRWFSPDPLGGDITNPQSLNRYSYALNNPESLTEPSGLDSCSDVSIGNALEGGSLLGGQFVNSTCLPDFSPGDPLLQAIWDMDSCLMWQNCDGQAGGSGGGSSTPAPAPKPGNPQTLPQKLTRQRPQRKPCTAASRAANTVEALDAAGDALVAFNLAAVHFGLAIVLLSAACLEPTPAEPLTCAVGGFGGVSVSAGGTVLTGFGVFQTKRAFSAIKQAVTCGPGS